MIVIPVRDFFINYYRRIVENRMEARENTMKDHYKNVLLVTNATSEVEIAQIKSALVESKNHGAKIKISLVHVIPTLPSCYFNIPSMAQLAAQYHENAQRSLKRIGDELGIAQRDQWLISGKIRTEVLRLAGKLNTHFILASSTSIQDLHKSFLFKNDSAKTPIRSINHLGASL